MNRIVIGIDGGGTKTRCLVADLQGQILGEGISGPSNYQTVGREAAESNIKAAVQLALDNAGRSLADVKSACAGLAGVARPEDQPVAEAMLSFLTHARTTIVTDARIALEGALEGRPGVVVISGTGSIALGRTPDGAMIRAGGWGWILGDEGSGYDIGRRALHAALAAHDGLSLETDLGRYICEAWGLERLDQAIRRVYADPLTTRLEIAGLVPVVVNAAEEGDLHAWSILAQAGRDLGLLSETVLKRLQLSSDIPHLVAVTGGVATSIPIVRDAMQEYLARFAPSATLIDARRTPAEGAVLMALQTGGDHSG